MSQVFTQAEWDALAEHGFAAIPRRRRLATLGYILEDAAPDERARFLRQVPPPARVAFRLIGQGQHRCETATLTQPTNTGRRYRTTGSAHAAGSPRPEVEARFSAEKSTIAASPTSQMAMPMIEVGTERTTANEMIRSSVLMPKNTTERIRPSYARGPWPRPSTATGQS